MTLFRYALLSLSIAGFLQAAPLGEVQGFVADAVDGHPIANVEVQTLGGVYRTKGAGDGRFSLTKLEAGDYQLQVTAPAYRTFTEDVHLSEGETKEFRISLVELKLRRADTMSVVEKAIPASGETSPGQFTLSGNDLENLATVLADDPLRAVQGLPGVTSNDDFEARFSLRGADFSRIGVYLDGILLHDAIHSLEGTDLSGSASVFNAGLIDQLDLHEDADTERFYDSSAGSLDVHMRDGNSDRYSLRIMANLGSAGFTAGGPLGHLDRCSWVAGYRKSYIQYLLANSLTDPSMAFGIEDVEGRASCRVSARNILSLDVIDSHTDLDRSSLQATLGANALMLVKQRSTFANLMWTYTPSDTIQITNRFAWMQDSFDAQNPVKSPLGTGDYGERVWSADATKMWKADAGLSGGFVLRALKDDGFTEEYDTVRAIEHLDTYKGSGLLAGGYLQETWTGLGGRLHVVASGRWDHHDVDNVSVYSPQASMTFRLLPSLELQTGWGQYTQFPAISVFGSNLGSSALLPLRSTQATAALEKRFGTSTRLRAAFYDRQDRDMLYQPFSDPRLLNGSVFMPPVNALYTNSLRGYGRGVEVYLQRSSTKGISGWVSYSYGRSLMHDGVTGDSFRSDWDQRHTINAYATYRLRPSVNLSSRWTYGSGFPIPGFLTEVNGNFFLSEKRNTFNLGPYQRLDVRVNKYWNREKWHTTLYAEVTNLTNKTNSRFGSLDGYSGSNGAAYVSIDTMFPILPSVGVVFER